MRPLLNSSTVSILLPSGHSLKSKSLMLGYLSTCSLVAGMAMASGERKLSVTAISAVLLKYFIFNYNCMLDLKI